jgi:hypothetical protein
MTAIQTTRASGKEPAEAPTENERVTARIVREDDGTTHHRYHVGGKVFESLTALRAALGSQQR